MADSGDEANQQPVKKRRVTKACDQCRRRRIKCDAYPGVAIDAPCVICTEAGTPEHCTYSRPTKKRGPQAGRAKTLEDKCATFERLLGHLLVTIPSFSTYVESFVASSATQTSPSPASSSSTSTFISPEEQQAKFTTSHLPDLLDSILPPNPVASAAAAKARGKAPDASALKAELPSPAASTSSAPGYPTPGPSTSGRKLAPLPSASSGLPQLPTAPPTSAPSPMSLQALAAAAVGAGPSGNGTAPPDGTEQRASFSLPGELTLPSESVRNLLLDLYFNQVVHPYLPMLDKTRFLRWSAHLPSTPSPLPTSSSSLPSSSSSAAPSVISPALYLAVFSLAVPYLCLLSPARQGLGMPEVWAQAARAALMGDVLGAGEEGGKEPGKAKGSVENVQAAVLLALGDWGAGEYERAWVLSGLSLTLALSLSLHLSASLPPDPDHLKLKTFHSALILHTLLALRLNRPPLVVLEDYNVPVPPDDGSENFELWRSDKTATELREEWAASSGIGPSSNVSKKGKEKSIASDQISSPNGDGTASSSSSTQPAVRSSSLSTFTRTASLCAIGLAILRWSVCPRRGNGQGLAAGEQERAELEASLQGWEEECGADLRLGGPGGGMEKVAERARWVVEMAMLAKAFWARLRPHASFSATVSDPVPQSLGSLEHLLTRYRSLFTLYRSIPTFDLTLDTLASTLFQQSDYAPHQHDTVLAAYGELGRVWPGARRSWKRLHGKVDEHKRELGLLRGVHPTASTHPSPPSAPPAPAPLVEPFQAFLAYSSELGPAEPATTVFDATMWDQTDLLVSLGLVMDPAVSSAPDAAGATGGASQFALPGEGAAQQYMPPVIPPSALPPQQAPHISPPPQLQTPSMPMAISPPSLSTSGTSPSSAPTSAQPPAPPLQQAQPQIQHYPPTFPLPLSLASGPIAGNSLYAPPPLFLPSFLPDSSSPYLPFPNAPAHYPMPMPVTSPSPASFPPPTAQPQAPAPLFDDANFSALPSDWPSTDLVTRWMDRGSLYGGFEGLGALGVPEGTAGDGAAGGAG
ncbi:hypothetical protein JCM8547_000119 [Rhodosporidiobolus lusitaniae]